MRLRSNAASKPLGVEPVRPLVPLLTALAIAVLFVALVDASGTWLALVFLACSLLGVAFWFGDLARLAMFLFILTLPIDLSKALIIQGGVYSPGMSVIISDPFLVVLLGIWAYRSLTAGRIPRRLDSLHWVGLAFLAWLWLSAFYSEDVVAGVLAAVTYTKFYVVYFVLTRLLCTPADIRLVLAAFFFGFLLQAVYVAAQVASGSPLELQGAKTTHLGTRLVFEGAGGVHAFRPSGFLHHPNVLADYLVFLIPSAAGLVLLGKHFLGRNVWHAALFLLLASLAILLITLSRGGWIATGIAMVFFGAVGLKRGLVIRRHVAAVVTAGIVGAVAVGIAYPAAYLRITESDQRSSESRWAMMDQALLIIRNNALLGVGLGSYNRAAQTYTPESFSHINKYFQDEIRKGVVHNKYLLLTAESGLIGMVLFLYLLWRFFRLLFPLSRWKTPVSLVLALGLSASILGQAVFYLFDHFYADVRMQLLWVLFGIFHALAQMQRQVAPPSTPDTHP